MEAAGCSVFVPVSAIDVDERQPPSSWLMQDNGSCLVDKTADRVDGRVAHPRRHPRLRGDRRTQSYAGRCLDAEAGCSTNRSAKRSAAAPSLRQPHAIARLARVEPKGIARLYGVSRRHKRGDRSNLYGVQPPRWRGSPFLYGVQPPPLVVIPCIPSSPAGRSTGLTEPLRMACWHVVPVQAEWSRRGSNPLPPACHAGALPNELRPRKLVLFGWLRGAETAIR